MAGSARLDKMIFLALAAVALFAIVGNAAVPSYYNGRIFPAGGAAKEIPGRINFRDYDLGGRGVAWVQDNVAYDGLAGGCTAAGRDNDGDAQHPAMTMTNHETDTKFDTFYTDGATPTAVRYPSPDTSFAANDWYIGACHPNNWFNVTVHVSKPGKYWISSIWAAMNTTLNYQISFIGTQYAATKDTVKTPDVNLKGYNTYHGWRRYPDFASIQLDSGVQVMKFFNKSYHINQDFLYFAADSGKFPMMPNDTRTAIGKPASGVPAGTQSNLSTCRETVRFFVPDAGKTKISVFDCIGRKIMVVLDRALATGNHSVTLNEAGLKNGIYFLRMEHDGASTVAKFQIFR